MKLFALLFTLFLIVNSLHADKPVKEDVLANPIVARSLADASEIVRLINELEWDSVKLKLAKGNQIGVVILEPQSQLKDWMGIGAYRGSDIDTKKQSVKHRFSLEGGRNGFHEVWLTYSFTQKDFNKPFIEALGW